ncbi:hypothetical protein BSKO_02487 [Bryopsis sp. KO-2023]|nr:hypothetical protein BSKO_02487 [Bryopsis sp. KO-2023]
MTGLAMTTLPYPAALGPKYFKIAKTESPSVFWSRFLALVFWFWSRFRFLERLRGGDSFRRLKCRWAHSKLESTVGERTLTLFEECLTQQGDLCQESEKGVWELSERKMPDSRRQEWRLPENVVVSTLLKLDAFDLARCCVVSTAWRSASQHPELRRMRINRNWRSFESMDPLRVKIKVTESDLVQTVAIGKDFIAVGDNNWLKAWDPVKEDWVMSFRGVPDATYSNIVFTARGWLVRGAMNSKLDNEPLIISGWKGDNASRLFNFLSPRGSFPSIVIVGVGESMIASGGADGHIALWEVAHLAHIDPTKSVGTNVPLPEEALLKGHIGSVNSLTSTENGLYLVSGGSDTTIRIWNVHTKTCESILECTKFSIPALAIHGDLLAGGFFEGDVNLWRFLEADSKCIRTFQSEEGYGKHISVLWLDENRLVSVAEQGEVCVWEVESGACVGRAKLPEKIMFLALSVWCSMERIILVVDEWVFTWDFDF